MCNLTHGGRTQVFKALVGSHNYNLNTPESDEDYKLFVLPTFDDLYSRKDYTSSIESDVEDIVTYDLRKLSHLLYKANINYLEILYSNKFEMVLPKDHVSYEDIKCIITYRENLCKMNMPYLFSACKGMYFNKRNDMKKNNKDFNSELGYAPKQAMSSYRVLDFLERYKTLLEHEEDHSFKAAITYTNEKEKEELLNIRKGIYSLEQINSILDAKYKRTIEICEEYYTSKKPDDKLKEWLDNKLKKIVRDNI